MLPIDFKSYLLRQAYDYIVDRGLTPYIQVFVNQYTDVPMEFVLNHSITLNIGPVATSSLLFDQQSITFQARFSGTLRSVCVPIGHVIAIYARENTELLLAFEVEEQLTHPWESTSLSIGDQDKNKEKKPSKRPHLRVLKKKNTKKD